MLSAAGKLLYLLVWDLPGPFQQFMRARRVSFAEGKVSLAGIALFSGSIYAYVLTGRKAFQYLTPFGGLSFMAGWGAIAMYHGNAAARSH